MQAIKLLRIAFNSPLFATVVPKVSMLIISYVLAQSYETSKSTKVVKFYVLISPFFSCCVTFIKALKCGTTVCKIKYSLILSISMATEI